MLELNTSHQFAGKVIGIRTGDVVSEAEVEVEVEVETAAGVISAVVTTASLALQAPKAAQQRSIPLRDVSLI